MWDNLKITEVSITFSTSLLGCLEKFLLLLQAAIGAMLWLQLAL